MKKLNLIPVPCTKEDVEEVLDTLLEVDITKEYVDKDTHQKLVDRLVFIKRLPDSKFDPSKTMNDCIEKTNKWITDYNEGKLK